MRVMHAFFKARVQASRLFKGVSERNIFLFQGKSPSNETNLEEFRRIFVSEICPATRRVVHIKEKYG